MRSSASLGMLSSVKGSEMRSSSSVSSGARPSSSSAIDRRWISFRRARPASSQRCAAHLFQQLLDHRPDAHHLAGLLDQVGDRRLAIVAAGVGVTRRYGHLADGLTIGADDHDAVGVFFLRLCHGSILA